MQENSRDCSFQSHTGKHETHRKHRMPSWLQHSYQQQEKSQRRGIINCFQSKQPTEPPRQNKQKLS